MRILYSFATGITRSRKYVMRSQYRSAFTGPALVSGVNLPLVFASASFQVDNVVPPRPGVRSVRSTPSRLMLYLIDGMPAFAQFLIMF